MTWPNCATIIVHYYSRFYEEVTNHSMLESCNSCVLFAKFYFLLKTKNLAFRFIFLWSFRSSRDETERCVVCVSVRV